MKKTIGFSKHERELIVEGLEARAWSLSEAITKVKDSPWKYIDAEKLPAWEEDLKTLRELRQLFKEEGIVTEHKGEPSSDVLIVNVEGGYLRADKSQDLDYPGIDVEFIPEHKDGHNLSNPRVLIEKPCDSHALRALIWNDPASEDYTKEIIL